MYMYFQDPTRTQTQQTSSMQYITDHSSPAHGPAWCVHLPHFFQPWIYNWKGTGRILGTGTVTWPHRNGYGNNSSEQFYFSLVHVIDAD